MRFIVTTIGILIAGTIFITAADILLPAKRISTEVHHTRTEDMSVRYIVCCTGGDIAYCPSTHAADLQKKQPIIVKRTRLLDRCISVTPSTTGSDKCSCS